MKICRVLRGKLTGDDTALPGVVGDDTSRVDAELRLGEAVVPNPTLAIDQLAKGAGDFTGDVEMEAAGRFSASNEAVDAGSEGC